MRQRGRPKLILQLEAVWKPEVMVVDQPITLTIKSAGVGVCLVSLNRLKVISCTVLGDYGFGAI